MEFYQPLARNEIQETEEQLVSRYIDGLRIQNQEIVSMFDPISLSMAHQRALMVEKQQLRIEGSNNIYNSNNNNLVNNNNHNARNQPSNTTTRQGINNYNCSTKANTNGLNCFRCGEMGHRISECHRGGKKVLFTETEEVGEDDDLDPKERACEMGMGEEELVEGDVGTSLVIRRACLTPRATGDEWLRNNIFQSTCTIEGKVCKFMIDTGSCENIISSEAVEKLGITTEQHPKPYKLAWLRKGGELIVSKRAIIPFSIGSKYKDSVWCNVVAMDACHLFLGRPWQFDRSVIHNGRTNTYTFVFNDVRIVLVPTKEEELPKEHPNLLSLARKLEGQK